LQESLSPVFVRHHRASLSGWTAAMASADIIGSIILGVAIFHFYAGPLSYDPAQLWEGSCGFVAAWIVAVATQNLYHKKTVLANLRLHGTHAVTSWALAFGIMLLLGFALQRLGGVSRVWFVSWALAVLVLTAGLRIIWSRYIGALLRQGGCVERAIVLAGSAYLARDIGDALLRESKGHIGIVSTAGIPGMPGGPTIDLIEECIRQGMIDRVIITGFETAVTETQSLLDRLARIAVDVTVIPSLEGLQGRVLNVDRIGMLPTVDLSLRPLSAVQLALKRAEDLVLATLILLFTAPVFLLVSIAIKLDSRGPVLFGQEREGYHNQVIRVWKFRTMFHNARDPRAIKQTSRGDPRVTRVGRLLRRLSLDELPQIINVLSGEMSIVGPRPHPLGMTTGGLPMQQILDEYSARQRLKPGITGLAQVSGCRGEIDSHEKLRRRVTLDCHYIDHWSLYLDLWIIARTAALVVFDSDAY
jgi:Undecaprenyl-phosphate glucose phosphotransferase